jgi:hypothetical protein
VKCFVFGKKLIDAVRVICHRPHFIASLSQTEHASAR